MPLVENGTIDLEVKGVPRYKGPIEITASGVCHTEVAVMAGVHPATASRALNQQTESLVNAETAARDRRPLRP